MGRGNIPSLAGSKTVSAFGLTPAGRVGQQRNTITSSAAYKTPDFTISMSADRPNEAGRQISAVGQNYQQNKAPQMNLNKADTAGFKDLTSQ